MNTSSFRKLKQEKQSDRETKRELERDKDRDKKKIKKKIIAHYSKPKADYN